MSLKVATQVVVKVWRMLRKSIIIIIIEIMEMRKELKKRSRAIIS